ncbi:hypothetical protein D3C86_474130 [compost metagenome]
MSIYRCGSYQLMMLHKLLGSTGDNITGSHDVHIGQLPISSGMHPCDPSTADNANSNSIHVITPSDKDLSLSEPAAVVDMRPGSARISS